MDGVALLFMAQNQSVLQFVGMEGSLLQRHAMTDPKLILLLLVFRGVYLIAQVTTQIGIALEEIQQQDLHAL